MAANKFATMLHRNTNKMTLVLIYALLEWALIALLLLNSLFSYILVKFADYFGLKRPCLLCSRVDHIFESRGRDNLYRDLVCESHASEISKLGYCSIHQKLAELQDMCEDCSSPPDCEEWSKKFAFFPWMKQIGIIQGGDEKVIENGEEESLNCSCCGLSLNSKFYPSCIMIKPSWEVLDFTQKQNLTMEAGVDDAQTEEGDHSDQSRSDFMTAQHRDEEGIEGDRRETRVFDIDGNSACSVCEYGGCKEIIANEDEKVERVKEGGEEEEPMKEDNLNVLSDDKACGKDIVSPETLRQHLEFYIDRDDCRLVLVDMIDSSIPIESQSHQKFKVEEDQGNSSCEDVILDFDSCFETKPVMESWRSSEDQSLPLFSFNESKEEDESRVLAFDSKDLGENGSSKVLHGEEGDEAMEENESKEEDESRFLAFDSKDLGENGRSKVLHGEEGDEAMEENESKEEDESRVLAFDLKDLGENGSSKVLHGEEGDEAMEENESRVLAFDSKDLGENGSSRVLHGEEGDEAMEENEPVAITQATQTSSHDDNGQSSAAGVEIDSDVRQATEDDVYLPNDEIDAEVSIGTEIPEHEPSDEIQLAQDGSEEGEEELLEFKTLSVEKSEKANNEHFSLGSEVKEIEEEKVPDTPTSVDRRELAAEESLDGSVISDMEGGDGVLTIEKLKSALRAERKALNELYAELEEERSASAVAASQTMAMINRLQEEKAAMQMEALQYQRMMEEQSEYDQEAMQLMNELMVKRDKEKQEVEKELEVCRKKVQDYEAKEKMMILRRMRDGCTRSRTSSGACSTGEESDGVSIDLNNESKEEDGSNGHEESSNQNTPADAVLYLEESLASFEEEKLSILEQLKELEEKLLNLNDEEEDGEEHYEDIKPIEDFSSGNNGNGYHEANGHSKIKAIKGKRLLPLFDAIEAEAEEGYDDSFTSQDSDKLENKKLAIEEEVDHVYERLQALEADREFLKHCISSLRKGDKGLVLLQEILEHLRDLRSMELRLRDSGEGVL